MGRVVHVKVATDFSAFPGAREKRHGKFSGQEFREVWLEPQVSDDSVAEVVVDLDGVDGYAVSFLEEAFGGLVRTCGYEVVKRKLTVATSDFPWLLPRIETYMREAV